jgi:hypothetical protein
MTAGAAGREQDEVLCHHDNSAVMPGLVPGISLRDALPV